MKWEIDSPFKSLNLEFPSLILYLECRRSKKTSFCPNSYTQKIKGIKEESDAAQKRWNVGKQNGAWKITIDKRLNYKKNCFRYAKREYFLQRYICSCYYPSCGCIKCDLYKTLHVTSAVSFFLFSSWFYKVSTVLPCLV